MDDLDKHLLRISIKVDKPLKIKSHRFSKSPIVGYIINNPTKNNLERTIATILKDEIYA